MDDCFVVSKFSSKGCVILKSIVWKIAWNESCQKVSWIFKLFRVLVVDSALLFFSSFANNACWTDFLYCYNGLVKEEKKINDTYTLSLTLNSRQDILDKIYINYLRGKTKTKEKSWYSRRNLSPFPSPVKKVIRGKLCNLSKSQCWNKQHSKEYLKIPTNYLVIKDVYIIKKWFFTKFHVNNTKKCIYKRQIIIVSMSKLM